MIFGKDSGVISEEAIDEANEKNFKLVSGITALLENVVKLAHLQGDVDVYGVLIL